MIKTNDGKRFKANNLNGQNKSKANTNSKPSKDKPKPPPPQPPPLALPLLQAPLPLSNQSNPTMLANNNDILTTNSVECDKCGMTFLNVNLLEMHKEKFCLGPQQADLVNHPIRTNSPPIQSKYIQNQVKFTSRDSQFVSPRQPLQPLSRISFGSDNNITSNNLNPIKTQSAINQLKSFKNKKSIEQSLKDMEDTLIRDTIRDKKMATSFNSPPPQQSQVLPQQIISSNQLGRSSVFSQNQFPANDPFRELLKEYSEFKKKEKSVLQEIYDYSPDLIPFRAAENNKENTDSNPTNTTSDFLSLFDNSEFDLIADFDTVDYLDTIDFASKASQQPLISNQQPQQTNAKKKGNTKKGENMNSEQLMRANLKRIQEKTLQLEKDRREIQFKLESLRNDGSVPLPVQSNQSINRILTELRDQQRINEAALTLLGQRLNVQGANLQPIPQNNLLSPNARSSNLNRVDLAKYLNGPYYNYDTFGADRLNNPSNQDYTPEEIRIMRLNYLQSGGHDPNVLHKFTEMEYDARFKDTANTNIRFLNRPSNQIELFKIRDKSELQIQNEAISKSLENEGIRPINYDYDDDDDIQYKIKKSNNKKKSRGSRKSSETSASSSKLLKNDIFVEMEIAKRHEMPAPLMSELFVENIRKNNPFSLDLDTKIRRVDQENKRLQAELELLQNKYDSLTNLRSPIPGETIRKRTETSLPPIVQTSPSIQQQQQQRLRFLQQQQQPQYEPMPNLVPQNRYQPAQNQFDDEQFYQYNKNTAYNYQEQTVPPQQPPPPPQPKQFQPNKQIQSKIDNTPKIIKLRDLPPSPYDPVGGFVIFIDFITNLEPMYVCARIITCLHHPKSGLGEPSVLPIVNCESFVDQNGSKSHVALISTKQPVPRCPPQQALTILVELQMAVKDPNETKLKSCAWSKIQLFDTKNRLLSGRWKIPLKNLPIKSDATINTLDTYPSFNSTELYYRLVNLRDSEEQTNAPISPAYANQYVQTTQFISDYEYYYECLYPEFSSQENIKYLNSPKTPSPRQKFQYDRIQTKQESKKFKIKYYTSDSTIEIPENTKTVVKPKKLKQIKQNQMTKKQLQALPPNRPKIKTEKENKLDDFFNDNNNIAKTSLNNKVQQFNANDKLNSELQITNKTIQNQIQLIDPNYRYQQQQKLQEDEFNSEESIIYVDDNDIDNPNDDIEDELNEIVRKGAPINSSNHTNNNEIEINESDEIFPTKKEFERKKNEKIKIIKKRINYLKSQKTQNYQEIYKHQQMYAKILNEQYNYKPPETVNRKSKSINNLSDDSKFNKSNVPSKRPYFVF